MNSRTYIPKPKKFLVRMNNLSSSLIIGLLSQIFKYPVYKFHAVSVVALLMKKIQISDIRRQLVIVAPILARVQPNQKHPLCRFNIPDKNSL